MIERETPGYYRSPEWFELRRQVLERDNKVCFYCGAKAVTADHVLARGSGGRDKVENLVAACMVCNVVAGGRWFFTREAKREWVLNEIEDRKRKHRERHKCK